MDEVAFFYLRRILGATYVKPANISLTLLLRIECSSGESIGVCCVKRTSNCETSSSPASDGLNGGSRRFARTSSQLIEAKNACRRIGAASSCPLPRRNSGVRRSSFRIRSRASMVKCFGKRRSACRIFEIVLLRFELTNGGFPVNMSNISAPNDHQSTGMEK